MNRVWWLLGISAFAVLSAASVWLGGLNQDEGWYLYAANLVSEGLLPYRDFFFTQGPMMPIVYSAFAWIWKVSGLLGARVFTLSLGVVGIVFAVAIARRLVPCERKNLAGLIAFLLLGCNIYHLYYLAIPKTYALASAFVAIGFYLLLVALDGKRWIAVAAGLSLAFAAGTRISLGALLAIAGMWLLASRQWKALAWFCVGGGLGLAAVYGPFVLNGEALPGLVKAQQYHAARGGFDVVWAVGSVSRLVRWYLPAFVLLAVSLFSCGERRECPLSATWLPLWGFLAVFAVQMLAPFPYEDYQVPVMGLLAVFAAANLVKSSNFGATALLTVAMCFAGSFGSPLLEKWMTNGQDRFWSLKKEKCELAQLREVANEIESLDPKGKDILTQDLYLAIETGRKVPKGLEMGPFAMLSDGEWKRLLESAPCRIAALSGYAFAIEPPVCNERPVEQQMEYWSILKKRYELVRKEDMFGQNATALLILRRK